MERKKMKLDHSNDQVSKPMTSASDITVVDESSSQDSRNQPSDGSNDSNPLGPLIEITIDEKFERGYSVSAKLGQVLLRGELHHHRADEQRALSSPAEGLSTAKVANTSSQASLHQSPKPHIDLNQLPLSPVLPDLDPQDQPGSISVQGTIDGKFKWGYFVSVKSGQKVLRGVLYQFADKQRAPSSQAEGTSTAMVAATSNQAPSSQAEVTNTAMVAAMSNQAPSSHAEGTSTSMVAATINQAPSSHAEGTSTAMVAATSNQAPSSQAEGTSTAMVAATSNQASSNQLQPQSDPPNQPASNPDTDIHEGGDSDSELQDLFKTLGNLPTKTISPQKPSLQPSDLYDDSAPKLNMLPTIDEAKKSLLAQIIQKDYRQHSYSDSLNQLGSGSDSVFYQATPDDSLNLSTADSHQRTNVLPERAFQGGENISPLLMQSQPVPIPMQETPTLPSTAVVSSLQTGTSISGNITVDDDSNRPPVSTAAAAGGSSQSATNESDEIQGDNNT